MKRLELQSGWLDNGPDGQDVSEKGRALEVVSLFSDAEVNVLDLSAEWLGCSYSIKVAVFARIGLFCLPSKVLSTVKSLIKLLQSSAWPTCLGELKSAIIVGETKRV